MLNQIDQIVINSYISQIGTEPYQSLSTLVSKIKKHSISFIKQQEQKVALEQSNLINKSNEHI